MPPHVISSLLYQSHKDNFPCLSNQGLCRIYIFLKSSTWHHIFIILVTSLDPKKCCRNYVESGTKCSKCPKLSSRAQNGRT